MKLRTLRMTTGGDSALCRRSVMSALGALATCGAAGGMRVTAALGQTQDSAQASSAATPQAWPQKPIRAISPITAGSASDIITRTVLEGAAAQLGQPIVVENRPGGDGTIGSGDVARAAPDGYTILSHSAALTVVATTHTDLPYDTLHDFAAVTPMAKIPSVLVVAPAKNIASLADLIASAGTRPLNFASPGAFTHLNTARFCRSARFDALRIPFKGAPEALAEVVAGRVDFYFAPIFAALPLIKTGQLVALAITGARRSSQLPAVPTFTEAGFADVDDNFWIGLFVPAQTPRPIVDRLHDAAVNSVQSAGVVDKLAKFGAEPMTATPDEFTRLVIAQIAANAVIIKAAGIALE